MIFIEKKLEKSNNYIFFNIKCNAVNLSIEDSG